MENASPSADESEESSEETTWEVLAPCDAGGLQPLLVAACTHEIEAHGVAPLQNESKHAQAATLEVHAAEAQDVSGGMVVMGVGCSSAQSGDFASSHRACPSWERSEEEVAAAGQVEWPPAHGHAISLACFGCEQRSEGAEVAAAQRRVHESLVHKCDHLKAGDECVCLDARDGQQWLATIKKLTENHAQVHFKGWGKSTDSWVTRDKLALKPSPRVLERIKQYNRHSKLKHTTTPKNHLTSSQARPTESDCSETDGGRGLEGREIRSRLRGVEMCRPACGRHPKGKWRAVSRDANRKQDFGSFDCKHEAGKKWTDSQEKAVTCLASGARAASKKFGIESGAQATDDLSQTARLAVSTPELGSTSSQGSALGARVSVEVGGKRYDSSVVGWIGTQDLYQLRTDGKPHAPSRLIHLPIPHKRVFDKTGSLFKTVPGGISRGIVEDGLAAHLEQSVLLLMGGRRVVDEMQDLCDTVPASHFVAAHALQLARLRHLADACGAHGVYVSEAGLHASVEEVRHALHMALHLAMLPPKLSQEATTEAEREAAEEAPNVRYSGVRQRKSGSKLDREFNKWEAWVEIGGQTHILGHFARKFEAARAWDMAAMRLLPRTTSLNLSDSRRWLASAELVKTIQHITVSASTCDGYRTVPLPAGAGAGVPGPRQVAEDADSKVQDAHSNVPATCVNLQRKPKAIQLQVGQHKHTKPDEDSTKMIASTSMPSKSIPSRKRVLQQSAQVPAGREQTRPRGFAQHEPQRLNPHTKSGATGRGPWTSQDRDQDTSQDRDQDTSQDRDQDRDSAPSDSAPSTRPLLELPPPIPAQATSAPEKVHTHTHEKVQEEVLEEVHEDVHEDVAGTQRACSHSQDVPSSARVRQQHMPSQSIGTRSAGVVQGAVLEVEAVPEQATHAAVSEAVHKQGRQQQQPKKDGGMGKHRGMAKQEAEAQRAVDASLGPKRVRKQKRLFGEQDGHADTMTTPPAASPRAAAHTKARDTSKARKTDKRTCPRPATPHSNKAMAGFEQQHGLDSFDTSGTDPAYTAHGAKCEVLSEGDWWSAHVVVRRHNMLRISYVGGTDDEDEWLPASEWPIKMRAPMADKEDADDSGLISYRGVEPCSNGTFLCVVDALEGARQDVECSLQGPNLQACALQPPPRTDRQLLRERFHASHHHVNACTTLLLPGAMSFGQSGGQDPLSQDPLARAGEGSDPHIAALLKTDPTPSAPPLKTTSKVTLGAFTSAREAAQLYDCVMLHVCGQGKQGCEVPLNLTTSKDYLAKCVEDGRLPFPDSFDSGMRQAVKEHYMHQRHLHYMHHTSEDLHYMHHTSAPLPPHPLRTHLDPPLTLSLPCPVEAHVDTVASHSTDMTSTDMPRRNALSAHTVKSLEERQEDGMSQDASLSATTLDASLTITHPPVPALTVGGCM